MTSTSPKVGKKVGKSNGTTPKIRGLWQHKNGNWYFSRMRDGIRRTVALETRDANEAAIKCLNLVDAPELGLPESFDTEIAAFIAYKVSHNEYSRFTAPQRTTVLNKFKRWAEDKGVASVSKVTPTHVSEFYYDQRSKLKESTVQSYVTSALSPFFRWLKDERKVISQNPVDGLKMAKLDLHASIREKFCSSELRDDLLKLSQKIPEEVLDEERARWIAFILHAGFEAGFRKNEIIEARPSWFDIDGKTVKIAETPTFRPKDREKRHIPLSSTFMAFLKKYPMKGTWCIAPEVERIKADYRYDFEHPYEVFMKWAGQQMKPKKDLSWVTPHIMRHTFASLLASAGVSLYKIAKWLGDTEKTAAKHYAHLQAGDEDIELLRGKKEPEKKAKAKPSKKVR